MSVCHVQSTPAGLLAPDHYGAAARPLVSEKQRLPRKVFRRSIAWLSASLSTLRRTGYPGTTQDSLPAVGQTLLDGLSPARFQRKVSECFVTSHPPSPGFAWRNHINRCSQGATGQIDASLCVCHHRLMSGHEQVAYIDSCDCRSGRDLSARPGARPRPRTLP